MTVYDFERYQNRYCAFDKSDMVTLGFVIEQFPEIGAGETLQLKTSN